MENEQYLESIVNEIKLRLPDYLTSVGVQVPPNGKGKFRCFNYREHAHADANPSASIHERSGYPRFHCFTCNLGGTTIDAAGLIENLPVRGPEFVTVTIPKLAEKLGIPFEMKNLPKKDRDRRSALNAIADASNFVVNNADLALLELRGLTKEDTERFRIGTGNFSLMLTELRKTYPDSTLRNAGIIAGKTEEDIYKYGEDLFMKDGLVLTISDQYGNPVGFVRRDMNFETKKENGIEGAKYKNSPTNDYYNKSKTLFLLNHAYFGIGATKTAFVFEGYIDVITAHKHDIMNSVALGGVAFTQDHLDMLVECGAETVVLCLDNDKEGIKSTLRTIDQLFKPRKDISLKIIAMDEPGEDPDSYIRKFGSERFLALPRLDYIEWSITVTEKSIIDDVAFNRLMNEIANYTESPLLHHRYAQAVAKKWNYDVQVVQQEIKMAIENNYSKANKEIDLIAKELHSRMRDNTGEALIPILEEYLDKMESVKLKIYNKKELKEREEEFWDSIYKSYAEAVPDPLRIQCYQRWGKAADLPKTEGLIIVAGREHHGKSTLLRQLAIDVAEQNPDVLILYYTLDDSKRLSVPGFVGATAKLPMRLVRNYNSDSCNSQERLQIDAAFRKLKKLSNNFKLRDSSECHTLAGIKKDILTYRSVYGTDKKINVFIDALNDLKDFKEGDESRTSAEKTSDRVKKMTVRYNCNVWATVHLRKQKGRPSNDDIKETSAIAYLADLLILVYNEILEAGSSTQLKTEAPVSSSYKHYPIVEIKVSKNKLTDHRGLSLFKMHSDEGWLEELDPEDERAFINLIEAQQNKSGLVSLGPRKANIQDDAGGLL